MNILMNVSGFCIISLIMYIAFSTWCNKKRLFSRNHRDDIGIPPIGLASMSKTEVVIWVILCPILIIWVMYATGVSMQYSVWKQMLWLFALLIFVGFIAYKRLTLLHQERELYVNPDFGNKFPEERVEHFKRLFQYLRENDLRQSGYGNTSFLYVARAIADDICRDRNIHLRIRQCQLPEVLEGYLREACFEVLFNRMLSADITQWYEFKARMFEFMQADDWESMPQKNAFLQCIHNETASWLAQFEYLILCCTEGAETEKGVWKIKCMQKILLHLLQKPSLEVLLLVPDFIYHARCIEGEKKALPIIRAVIEVAMETEVPNIPKAWLGACMSALMKPTQGT